MTTRPYLLFGAPLTGIGFVALFLAPASPAAGAALIAGMAHFAFRTLYAVVAVPYAAMSARVTRDAAVCADFTGVRMLSAAVASVLVATLTLRLAEAAGGGRSGWLAVATLYAVIATATLLTCAYMTRGVDAPTSEASGGASLPAELAAMVRNWPFLVVLAALAITSFTSTIFQKSLIYYFKYVVGDAAFAGTALGVSAAVVALCIPLFAWIARRWGKRPAWLLGIVPSLAGLVCWRLADGNGNAALLASLALMAVGSAGYYVGFWAMLPDTVEFGEWRTGTRAESLVFGVAMLGQKAALGLGAGVLGIMLTRFGYVADAQQTPAMLADLKAAMFWIPFSGTIVVAALVAAYPLTPARH